jgi:hypothetical protein
MKELNLFYQCHVTGRESSIWQLQCHLRIIHQFGRQIAIASPQNCEIGWFIPAQVEKLVTQIVQDFELNPDRLTWVEHDPNYASRQTGSEYSEIEFQWHQRIATNPQWRSLSDGIKFLIGEPFFAVDNAVHFPFCSLMSKNHDKIIR